MKHIETSARSGFTLIELLVVIAIIAVLAGLLFPVMGKVRLRSVETRTTSNLRQIGTAMNTYAAEHDSTLPGPLKVEQYPTFGIDTKRDTGSLAKLLAPYIGLAARKTKDDGQATPSHLLAAPLVNVPDGLTLDEIPGYVMNMEIVGDYDQPAWGSIDEKEEKPPLTRPALGSWRELKSNPDPTSPNVNLTLRWAMRHTDQVDCKFLKLEGDWVQKLPAEPLFCFDAKQPSKPDHYQTLFFDMHVEAYKPTYDEQKAP